MGRSWKEGNINYHYVWLAWSSAFLLPWVALYLANTRLRTVMWRTSFVIALFGLTEPIFVPRYWNPPSLFELAQRTGFDLESLIFTFGIGGIGAALYAALARQHFVLVSAERRRGPLHRFHVAALLVPPVVFVPIHFLPWNPIYPVMTSLVLGAIASVACRPGLRIKTLVGGVLFLSLYTVFMLGLVWFAPGYIEQVWNLPALSGVLIGGIPLEELLFGLAFGLYWTGVYEHVSWSESVTHTADQPRPGKPLMTPSVNASRTAVRSESRLSESFL